MRRTIPLLVVALVATLAAPLARHGTTRVATADESTVPPAKPSAAPTLARVRLGVSTTSDWTKVRVVPARLGAVTVVSNPARLSVTVLPDGVQVDGAPPSGARVEVVAVLDEHTGADPLTIVTQKGARGRTSIRLENTTARTFTVATFTNDRSDGDLNERSTTVDRGELFGNWQLVLPRADPRPLVIADYYGWFRDRLYDDPRLADRPVDRTDAWDRDDVLRTTREARRGGIDGFAVSWQGEAADGTQLDHVVWAAGQTAGVATVYLETAVANAARDAAKPPEPAVVERWLGEALARAGSGSFLTTADGVPVVFAFRMGSMPAASWARVLASLAAKGTPVRIVGDMNTPAYRAVQWGAHRYDPHHIGGRTATLRYLTAWNRARMVESRGPAVLGRGDPQLFVATVSPGWDDTRLRGDANTTVPRGESGERYEATWEAAARADADWVLVTSWNEWFEGTAVQPSELHGDRALQQTALLGQRHRARQGG